MAERADASFNKRFSMKSCAARIRAMVEEAGAPGGRSRGAVIEQEAIEQ